MKILDKYIAKEITERVFIVALALLGFDLFFTLVHELKVIGQGSYTLGAAFGYLALTIPNRLYLMFPWAALIGALLGLGALASHSELVIMRVSGISVARITIAVLKAALWLMLIVVGLGEGIAPTTERLAQERRTLALSGGQALETADGLWVRHGAEFIHIDAVRAAGELLGITRYQFNAQQQLQEALYAKRAILGSRGWELQEVQGTRFQENKTEIFSEKTLVLPQLFNPEILETARIKHPERLSIFTLWRTIRQRSQNELNIETYELAFWSKLFQPLVVLMMVWLAVPFVFGPLRSVSMGFKMVTGILVAFTFHTVNNVFAPLTVVYQLPPVLAVLLPIVVFSGIGAYLLRRVR